MKIWRFFFVEKVDFHVTKIKFRKTLKAIRSASVDDLPAFPSVHSCWTGLPLLSPGHTVDTRTSDTPT